MKIIRAVFLLILCVALSACGYTETRGKDLITHVPYDSVKMGFWDEMSFWLWGVIYDRFRFDLRVEGDRGLERWEAVVECKNINDGPSFTMDVDGIPRTFIGRRIESNSMAYDLSPMEVEAIAKAKKVVLRVEHIHRLDDATLRDDQLQAIKRLWERHSGTPKS